MEFIKIDKDRYMIKDSNNYVVSKEEMLKLQKNELILKDIESPSCQGKTTEAIKEIDEELKNVKHNTIKKAKSTTK